jgi:hypothetical protein
MSKYTEAIQPSVLADNVIKVERYTMLDAGKYLQNIEIILYFYVN